VVYVAPNVSAMSALASSFTGFGLEFSLQHKHIEAEWNDLVAEKWRAEMAAILAAEANATRNDSELIGRRLQFGVPETPSVDDVPGTGVVGDLGTSAIDLAGNGTIALIYDLGYSTVEEFCANVTVSNVNETSTQVQRLYEELCLNQTEVFAVFQGPTWIDASDQLCRKSSMTPEFTLVANMLNPVEHCNTGWTPDVCLSEGKAWTYAIKMSYRPASDVIMTVSGKFIQTNVTHVFTREDALDPHEVTIHMKDNMAITGHYWMELNHEFSGGVRPVGIPSEMHALGRVGAKHNFRNTSRNIDGYVCTNRDKDRCIDEATAWSHAKAPKVSDHDVSGWSPGRLWSATTRRFYPLKLPVLVLENDKYKLHEYLGETGRKWKLDSRVQKDRPAWRGPFTLGPSFFSENIARCPNGEASAGCMNGEMWDLEKKRRTTETTAYPPAPPLTADCTSSDCTSTGEDPGYWTHDPQFGLPDVSFRLYGPEETVDTITLKIPQNKLFIFRPCYVEPPGLPDDFYALNNIDCPTESGYNIELIEDPITGEIDEAPPYPLIYEGATENKENPGVDPLCLWSVTYQWESNPPTIVSQFVCNLVPCVSSSSCITTSVLTHFCALCVCSTLVTTIPVGLHIQCQQIASTSTCTHI
jgi:hypothetical protein